ncbi:MAG TPA: NIPSNAP family protein [Luteitalea sp.]|nr:NIPSNAP family protein [Luteitalea sp.]
MTRRDFLSTTPAAALTLSSGGAAAQTKPATRQWYELRRYRVRVGTMRDTTRAYLRDALVPALGRLGLGPVGVFDVTVGEPPTAVVLIPHPNAESAATLWSRLAVDAEYTKVAAPFFNAPADRPVFDRIESSLLQAFTGMPTLDVPDTSKPRIFELRRYEGPSEAASLKKIEMFDSGGELAVFRKVGFRPVFFGQTVFGVRLPQFEYMLTYASMAERETQWNAFRNDPDWKVLSQKEEYKDAAIMSGSTATYLAPQPISQI